MSAQVAGGISTRRVPFVMQNLGVRHIHVEPTRPAESISEVDVLHVHEVALIEAADGIERGTANQ
jgi:hypothetical protein